MIWSSSDVIILFVGVRSHNWDLDLHKPVSLIIDMIPFSRQEASRLCPIILYYIDTIIELTSFFNIKHKLHIFIHNKVRTE